MAIDSIRRYQAESADRQQAGLGGSFVFWR
jgi:hypothetical protein